MCVYFLFAFIAFYVVKKNIETVYTEVNSRSLFSCYAAQIYGNRPLPPPPLPHPTFLALFFSLRSDNITFPIYQKRT